jgi:hypothetical protein
VGESEQDVFKRGLRGWINKLFVFRRGLRGGLAGCVQKRLLGGLAAEVGIDTCESVECSTSIKNPTFDRKY